LEFLHRTFKESSYSDRVILHALNPPDMEDTPTKDPTSVAFLPFDVSTFNHISRVLTKHNIRTVGLPPKKVTRFLRPIKDDLGLKTPGIYSIPCKCGRAYIGQIRHSNETSIKTAQSVHLLLSSRETGHG
jgi:hypothetical protein